MKQVKIIGIGMDGQHTLTLQAKEAIERSQVLIGASRMLAPFEKEGKECFCSYQSQEIVSDILKSDQQRFAILMSGDCGFYSGTKQLFPLLEKQEPKMQVEIISGISSPVYFCNQLGIPWQDVYLASLHGTSHNIVRTICSHEKTFFLLGGEVTAADVCRKLCEYGREQVAIYVGENLASPKEKITKGIAKDFCQLATEQLAVLLAVNPRYEKAPERCIEEECFVRGAVPMTKAEVRGVCVSRLQIGYRDVCWDMGCGTGSVSVEMALACGEGKVYAVDHKQEAVDLTEKNKHHFGCDNIEVFRGEAQEICQNWPAPDCVFVGGSTGAMEAILTCAFAKNPRARVVITAVSLETLQQSITLLEKLGWETSVMQMAVTRTRKIGNHTMLQAENPIYVIETKGGSTHGSDHDSGNQ